MIPWEPAWTDIMAGTWKTIGEEFAARIPHALLSDLKALTPILWKRYETIEESLRAEGVTENGVRFYCNQLLNTWSEMISVQEKATQEMVSRGMPPPKPRPHQLRITRAGADRHDLSIEWVSVEGATVEEISAYLAGQLEVEDIQALVAQRRNPQPVQMTALEPPPLPHIPWGDVQAAARHREEPRASVVLAETEDAEILSMPDIECDDDIPTEKVVLEVEMHEMPDISDDH